MMSTPIFRPNHRYLCGDCGLRMLPVDDALIGSCGRLQPSTPTRRPRQNEPICACTVGLHGVATGVQIGGFARACRLADSHGPLTVSQSEKTVDRRVRICQDGGAVSVMVIDRSRTALMERCHPIVRLRGR
jgi:hypothetical protein